MYRYGNNTAGTTPTAGQPPCHRRGSTPNRPWPARPQSPYNPASPFPPRTPTPPAATSGYTQNWQHAPRPQLTDNVNHLHYSTNPYAHAPRPPSSLGRHSPKPHPQWQHSTSYVPPPSHSFTGMGHEEHVYDNFASPYQAPIASGSASGRNSPVPNQGYFGNGHSTGVFTHQPMYPSGPSQAPSYPKPRTPSPLGGFGGTVATVYSNNGNYSIHNSGSGRRTPPRNESNQHHSVYSQYSGDGRAGWGLSGQPVPVPGWGLSSNALPADSVPVGGDGSYHGHHTHASQDVPEQTWFSDVNLQQNPQAYTAEHTSAPILHQQGQHPSNESQQASGSATSSQQAYAPYTVEETGNTIDLNFYNNPDSYYKFDKKTGRLYKIMKKSRQKFEIKKNSEEWKNVAKATKAGAKAVGRGALAALQVAGLFADVLGAF